jgi:hypothetical protein
MCDVDREIARDPAGMWNEEDNGNMPKKAIKRRIGMLVCILSSAKSLRIFFFWPSSACQTSDSDTSKNVFGG